MKNKYRNIFLAFGIITVLIMIFTFDMDYQELWLNLKRAGVYLPLVLLLWLFVYLINTVSWYIIIRSGGKTGFSFVRLYKFTVTGFALNYVTPVGLMGGEPYRIMELKPYIGIERATPPDRDKRKATLNLTKSKSGKRYASSHKESRKRWRVLFLYRVSAP